MGRVGFMGLLLRWFGLWGFAALGNSLRRCGTAGSESLIPEALNDSGLG